MSWLDLFTVGNVKKTIGQWVKDHESELTGRLSEIGLSTTIDGELTPLKNRLRSRDIPNPITLNLTYVNESPASANPQLIPGGVTHGVLDGPFDILGSPLLASGEMDTGYFRNTLGMVDSDANRAPYQLEWVSDSDIEFRLRAFSSTPKFRLYVDDVPAQGEDPQVLNGITVSGGTNFRLGVTHPSPGNLRRFRLQFSQAGVRVAYTAPTANIYAPKMRRLRVGIIGTSFSCSSGSTALFLDSWVWRFGENFGVDILNAARNGSGYVGTGAGTHADQVAPLLTQKPDIIIVEGSGNDVGASGSAIQAAATALYNTLNNYPLIVVGMLPRGASGETSSTAGKVITYTKAGAKSCENVLGFIDPIGTVDPLTAYTATSNYAAGAKVSYLGSTWKARVQIPSAPSTFDRTKWSLLSWNLGTGRVGATTADGNRDVNVQSDDTHPTAKGSRMIADMVGPRIGEVISSA